MPRALTQSDTPPQLGPQHDPQRDPPRDRAWARPDGNFGPSRRSEQPVDGPEVVRSLIRMGEHLSSRSPLGGRLTLLCKETAALLDCDRSSIMLWDGEFYRASCNWGNPPDIAAVFESYRVPTHAPLIIEMEAAASFVVVNDAATHHSVGNIAATARVHSIVVAPMVDEAGQRLGFLTAEFNERIGTFDECRAEIVLGAARLAQAAVITDRCRLQRRQADLGHARILSKLVDAEDEERRRIARELHDDLIQRVFALQLRLETVGERQEPVLPLEMAPLVDEARALSASLRSLLSDVHPTAVDGKRLGTALKLALDRKAESSDWTTAVVDELTTQPPTANLTVLFRIAQQALHNSATHASASTATIHLRTIDGGSEVRVSDDGCGFEPSEVSEDRFGLTSMSERATGAGGRFHINSRPGKGTQVIAWLPNGEQTANSAHD